MTFVTGVVLQVDFHVFIAERALSGQKWAYSNPTDLAKDRPGKATLRLRDSRQQLLEMFLVRSVDNFQSYIVDILRDILHRQPSILNSSQPTLATAYVFQFASMDQLVHDLIERKVNDLSYSGFTAVVDWCGKRGIELAIPESGPGALNEVIAMRNLISHNRGIVDEKYLRTVDNPRFRVGQLRELQPEDTFNVSRLLQTVVAQTDEVVAHKFDLDRENLPPEELEL